MLKYSMDYSKYEYTYETLKSNREIYNPFIPLILIECINNNHY